MDFFEAQERARKSTRWLVWWFILCVIGVIVVVYIAAVIFGPNFVQKPDVHGYTETFVWWNPDFAKIIAPSAAGIIGLGSMYKIMQLSGGGSVVASDLGGRAVDPSSTDPLERRLLNVVQEMAIASGLPAPEVWVLDHEAGINAFAAGTDPSNAVVGVTRGCLEQLNRAELQGVVAHEFSHILNGDMKLNMRLMGWIFGLLMITMLGRKLIEVLRHVRSSSDSKNSGGVIIAVVLAGAVLWLIGSVGVFFAKLLQAGVSRQREYLADASAVQFTRNPSGLADALRKVGGFSKHGAVNAAAAGEARHLFFAKSDLFSLSMATHPPLETRIKAIDPTWTGEMIGGDHSRANRRSAVSTTVPTKPVLPPRLAPATGFSLDRLGDSSRLDPQVGNAIRRRLEHGELVIHSKAEAKTLLFGLLVAQDTRGVRESAALLEQREGSEMAEIALGWSAKLHGKSAAEKLALVDLSLPWLRRMSRDEASRFIEVTQELIAADQSVNLFEFMLQKVISRHVGVGLGLRAVARVRHRSLAELANPTAALLGAFVSISKDEDSLKFAREEFERQAGKALPPISLEDIHLNDVSAALVEFEAATPIIKAKILRICGMLAMHDGVLDDREIELLRAAAEAIGAPLPPLSKVVDA